MSDDKKPSKEVKRTDVPVAVSRGVVPVAVEATDIRAVVRIAADAQKKTVLHF